MFWKQLIIDLIINSMHFNKASVAVINVVREKTWNQKLLVNLKGGHSG